MADPIDDENFDWFEHYKGVDGDAHYGYYGGTDNRQLPLVITCPSCLGEDVECANCDSTGFVTVGPGIN